MPSETRGTGVGERERESLVGRLRRPNGALAKAPGMVSALYAVHLSIGARPQNDFSMASWIALPRPGPERNKAAGGSLPTRQRSSRSAAQKGSRCTPCHVWPGGSGWWFRRGTVSPRRGHVRGWRHKPAPEFGNRSAPRHRAWSHGSGWRAGAAAVPSGSRAGDPGYRGHDVREHGFRRQFALQQPVHSRQLGGRPVPAAGAARPSGQSSACRNDRTTESRTMPRRSIWRAWQHTVPSNLPADEAAVAERTLSNGAGNTLGKGVSVTNDGMGAFCLQPLGSEFQQHQCRVDGHLPQSPSRSQLLQVQHNSPSAIFRGLSRMLALAGLIGLFRR